MRNSWPKRGPKNVSTMADYIGRYVLVFMVATTEKCLSQNCLRFKGLYSNFRKYYFKYCQGDIMVFFSLSTICSVIKPSTYRYELLDQLLVPTENKLFCDSQFGWTLKLSVVARALSPQRVSPLSLGTRLQIYRIISSNEEPYVNIFKNVPFFKYLPMHDA